LVVLLKNINNASMNDMRGGERIASCLYRRNCGLPL
jgi:hypothetical protein